MNEKDKNNIKIPKDFWNKERPNVSIDEVLEDVEPIEWNNNISDKIIVYSKNEDKIKK